MIDIGTLDLHVGNFLKLALLKKGEKLASHPVDSHDIDVEALFEIIPARV
jgi:hypothetical protein